MKTTQAGMTTKVYLNLMADGRIMHVNSHNAFDGLETNAYLLALTYRGDGDLGDPDGAVRWFIGSGSYLRKNGTVFGGDKKETSALTGVTWGTTLVVQNGVVLCADDNEIVALFATDGSRLWSGPSRGNVASPPDVFVANGILRSAEVPEHSKAGFTPGRGPLTGEAGLARRFCIRKFQRRASDAKMAGKPGTGTLFRWVLIG
ncbi:MAG: hypothetical protein NTW86_09690 [Candidatus Sumerlaeota bacterium]|nr:hypothetical protein [Candidatus Sumerlaeota bacterium]